MRDFLISSEIRGGGAEPSVTADHWGWTDHHRGMWRGSLMEMAVELFMSSRLTPPPSLTHHVSHDLPSFSWPVPGQAGLQPN